VHLVLVGTSGTQRYIFASNRLREAVGASHLVAAATTVWVRAALDEVGGSVVQESSGSTLVVVADADAARGLARTVTMRALREAPGLPVVAVSVEIAGAIPTAAEIATAFATFGRHTASRPSAATRHQRLPVVASCHSTDLPARSWHVDADTELRGAPDDDLRPRPLSAAAIAKRDARPAARAALAARLPGHRLVALHRFADTVEWVGIVHADGNGLGEFFAAAATELGGEAGEVSAQVQEAADAALRDSAGVLARLVGAGRPLPLVPLIVGGDDLTVLVDGRFALPFVEAYLDAFTRHSAAAPLVRRVRGAAGGLTASAGVALVKPHFPFSVGYRLCEELAAEAKRLVRDHPGTHGIDVHVLIDSRVTDLRAIRSGYQVGATTLTRRPFLVGTNAPPERSWPQVRRRLETLADVPRGGEGLLVTRTQLYALRSEMRHDPQRARRRLADLDTRVPATGEDRARLDALRGPDGSAAGLLDLLELRAFASAVSP
jgi:hypothetical protein